MSARLKVVICWHMHQPQYQDRPNGKYQLPWTYLHAIKDYSDMAAHLEAEPRARVVVNFAPTLLEQLDDYARNLNAFIANGETLRDPLLAALADPVLPSDYQHRLLLVGYCLRANEDRLIKPNEPYVCLAAIARHYIEHPESAIYISDQFLVDILIWYHLAWLGEFVRRNDERVKALIDKGVAFSLHDREQLVHVIAELLDGVIGRYRRLAERGQVELSVTPYAHPIVPLLLELDSAREAMPDIAMPTLKQYPGGEARVRWHMRQGLETFRHYFGFSPQGCWPSEGSVSGAALKYFEEAGFAWVASGESVLRNSLKASAPKPESKCLHTAYTFGNTGIANFFRDDGLSDLIGFTYSGWHADDAVANLLSHLDNIATACKDTDNAVVSIILDGENAWEHYPQNGYYFLSALYKGLCDHPKIDLTTFSDCLKAGVPNTHLPKMVAGSWVYGTFSTWIGDVDKNRAWDMLGDAKQRYDRIMAAGHLSATQRAKAERQLAICEGSDWFWWFGDYNSADSVSNFERLYRQQLTALYLLLGEEPPEYLAHVFARGGGRPAVSGTMRRGSEH